MRIWFRSDEHFGHKNVIRLCNRPFQDLHHMHKALTDNHNKLVKPDDLVYFLGDFAFCNAKELQKYVQNLAGRKVLIQGNHDKIGEIGYLNAGFELVLQQAQIKIGGKYVNLSHYPYKGSASELADAEAKGYKIKYLDRRMHNDGNWLLHGHVHGSWDQRGRMINVGADVRNFKPISINEIESIITKTEQGMDELVAEGQALGDYNDNL